jgi:hypothetical protein
MGLPGIDWMQAVLNCRLLAVSVTSFDASALTQDPAGGLVEPAEPLQATRQIATTFRMPVALAASGGAGTLRGRSHYWPTTGRVMVKVDPLPSRLVTSMSPFI